MSDVQSIFDKMINSGYYNRADSYMCLCLKGAFDDGVITYSDYMYAFGHIKKYLGVSENIVSVRDVRSLSGTLYDNNLPHSFDDTLAIYKDWESRPVLKDLDYIYYRRGYK